MPERDALYPVIHRVERNEPVGAYQKKIEVKKGNWPLATRTYYLVSDNKNGKAAAHGNIRYTVKARDKDWTLVLQVEYTAAAAHGLPERIAQKIVDAIGGDHPQVTLETLMTDLMGEFIVGLGAGEFISQFDRKRIDLAAYVQTHIEERAGLSLSLKIIPSTGGRAFENSRKLEKEIRFQVQDHLDPLTAKLSLDLDSQPGIWPYIHHGALDQLASEIIAAAESFLKMVSLQQIKFEMKALRERLREELEKLANKRGRTVSRLGLECVLPDVIGNVQSTRRITIEKIEFPHLIEYPEPVIAKCELQLELERLGTFLEHKSPDLISWATETVREAILKKLLDVPYIDLFLGRGGTGQGQSGFGFFDRKMAETEAMVRQQAENIGYRVSAFFIRTNLQFDELRRGFTIKIAGEQYETSVPGYPAGLDVEVFARITDEGVIRGLFNQDVDIKKIIKESLRERIRQRLRQMSPEKYYTHFEGSDETGSASVLDGLSSLIKGLMNERYKAADVSVTCTQQLTDLAKLFNDLRKDQREFTVADERSGLKFHVVCRVDSLIKKHWEEFQFRRPTADLVQKNVEYCIKQRLSAAGRERLEQMQDTAIRDSLSQLVGLEDVPAELGVSVKFIYFARQITEAQKSFLDQLNDGVLRQLEESNRKHEIDWATHEAALLELQNQLLIAIKSGDRAEVDRIKSLIEEMKTAWAENEKKSAFRGVSDAVEKAAQKEVRNLAGLTVGNSSGHLLSSKPLKKPRSALLTTGTKSESGERNGDSI